MEYSCLTTSSGFTFPGLVNGASLARIQRYRLGKRPQMSILNPSRRLRREIPSRTSAESLNESRLPGFHYDPFPEPLAEVAAGKDTLARGAQAPNPSDPLENYRRRLTRRPAFDYRPELADPKELI